jgi:hypothetical protein
VPATVTVSLTTLDTYLQHLARGAGERSVRLEFVPPTRDADSAYLRVTAFDPEGWWEQQDIAASCSSQYAPPPAVVDVQELKEALSTVRRYDAGSKAALYFDGNVTIGNCLLLGRDWDEVPPLPTDRTMLERLELLHANGAGLAVETLAGRLYVPPELVGCLRRRRASAFDLVTIEGLPHLSAEVAVPGGGVASIVAPLQELDEGDVPAVTDRRGATGEEVTHLVRALSSETSPEELARILKVGVGYVRRRAAAHPALSKELIYEIVNDGTEAMRAAAASNPSIGTRGSELAATDASPLVRAVIAANPAVPAAKLARLADDPVAQVRANAASNPTCPEGLLAQLAHDTDSTVRRAVALHENVAVDDLVLLARDPDLDVCAAVAEHPKCPTEVLDDLVGIVPDAVLANPSAAKVLLTAGSVVNTPRLRAAVARNPATPPKRLRRLSRDTDTEVLEAVAEHPQAPKTARRRARQRLDPGGNGT